MGERPTILLADDEEAITAELQPFLERAGFTVLVARDGEAALAAGLDGDPDLIVLDVLMPGLDGREVLRRLRAGGRFNPVVLADDASSPAWIETVPGQGYRFTAPVEGQA